MPDVFSNVTDFKRLTQLVEENWILALILFAFKAVINWKLLRKAGREGWEQFIPIYRDYVSYKLFWKTSIFWVMLFLPLLVGVGFIVLALLSVITPELTAIGALCGIAALIYVAFFTIIFEFKKAKCFNKGFGFGLGLVFLNLIFNAILALSDSCVYHKR